MESVKCAVCSCDLSESYHYGCEGCNTNYCKRCGFVELDEKTQGENDQILCRDCRGEPPLTYITSSIAIEQLSGWARDTYMVIAGGCGAFVLLLVMMGVWL